MGASRWMAWGGDRKGCSSHGMLPNTKTYTFLQVAVGPWVEQQQVIKGCEMWTECGKERLRETSEGSGEL